MLQKRMTTKEIILNESRALFMEKGFLATSTREIAINAGITQPNLYHYFKTKEDIYIAVLEKLSHEIKEELNKMVEDTSESLYASLLKILNYLRENHPANFSIMSHDMTHEISEENHKYLYQLWQTSYVQPLVKLFNRYETENSIFNSNELARYFYSIIAPFIQKENRFYNKVSSEKILYIFVYGILYSDEKEH
ncbi:TetR/AcrR family transcriptional regulator [Aerococcaceae bacterium DSM 111022]|nr:TetR/AcrR family transcriptional regulator [Aerococcaceae bacterium DSM 111022]